MEIRYRTQFGELLRHYGLSGHAVEIGVAEGRNAEVMISQPEITKLYLIDAWTKLNQPGDAANSQTWHENNFIEAQQRVSKHKDKAVFLRGMSIQMIQSIPDESLVLAYIDGDHTYDGAMRDLKAIYPKVKKGAIIAGHDYLNNAYGVNGAVNDFVRSIGGPSIHVIEEDELPMAGFWFIK